VALGGERRGIYRVLDGKPKGNMLLERPISRWEDNIKNVFSRNRTGDVD
jgi:hypothetical protein